MIETKKMIFVGGYTKSGTTFIGRSLGIFKDVYAYGELEYFRIIFPHVYKMAEEFNLNIQVVNKEVYDGHGTIPPITRNQLNDLHKYTLINIMTGGKGLPEGCKWMVEKTPRNIFYLRSIHHAFPESKFLCIYRRPDHVFRSLMRHMSDHRSPAYADPTSPQRNNSLINFTKRWNRYINIIDTAHKMMTTVQYESVSNDLPGFLDFAKDRIFQEDLPFSAPIESLSKESYLASLPKEQREKSLVQTGPYKIALSRQEIHHFNTQCGTPSIKFDF